MQKITAACKKLPEKLFDFTTQNINAPFVMKISAFFTMFMFVTIQLLTAKETHAQRIDSVFITLELKHETLANSFASIEKLSGFHIAYPPEQVSTYQEINLKKDTRSVQRTLELLLVNTNLWFKEKKKSIIIFKRTSTATVTDINTALPAPPVILHGKVTNEKDEPISGASVTEKKSHEGTTTNEEGKFSLTFSSNDNKPVLEISCVGYNTLIKEINTTQLAGEISFTLIEAANDLNEVVVVGYGTKRKANLTGALSVIKGSELEKVPVTNLTNTLAGQVPGLIINTRSGEPGNDDATIYVRGKGTLGNTSALIVIDGIPDRAGGFSRLNPADIESFTVLKDATGAIYGARAANGVILITTKRGISGKPVLSVGSNWAATQPTRVPHTLNSWEYAQSVNEYNKLTGQLATYSDADIQKYKDGSDPLGHPNTNWWDAVMKTWTLQQNQLVSLRGGSDRVKYFLSGQYEKQDGMYKGGASFYKQYQTRANIDVNVTDNFKIGVDALYRNQYRNSAVQGYDADGIFSELWNAYPYLVPVYPDGKVGVGIGGGPGNSMVYILNEARGYQTRKNDYLQTKISFNWNLSKLLKGLYADGYYSYDLQYFNYTAFNKTPPPAYSYNSTTNSFTEVTSSIPPSLFVEADKAVQRLYNLRLGYNWRSLKHTLETFVAYEQYTATFDTLSGFRNNFLSNQIPQLFAGGTAGQNNYSATFESARQNLIGRISYTYDNKYLLDYNMRYDGSANFPKGNRFGFFPAISAGWRISQEPFFHSNLINELKIRGSWGRTGNDAVPPFQYIQTYRLMSGQAPGYNNYIGAGYFYGPTAAAYPSFTLGPTPNPNITWEIASTTNFGTEVQLLKNALSVNLDVFRSVRSGILIPPTEQVPSYTGLTLPYVNLGKVINRGIEISVAYNRKPTKSFSYTVSGNFTYVRNKVSYMGEATSVPDYQKKTGYPIDAYLLYQSQGLFQDSATVNKLPHPAGSGPGDIIYKDVNGDGVINSLDQVRTTLSITPEIIYGAAFNAHYKSFDCTIFFQGQARAKSLLKPTGLNMAREFYDDRWQQPGDNKYPRTFNGPTSRTFGSNSYNSDFWLRNDGFLRLKNVEIAYNLPEKVLGNVKVKAARIYVSGYNLFSIDKFGPSFDPESPVTSGRYYPQQRVINVGANLTF